MSQILMVNAALEVMCIIIMVILLWSLLSEKREEGKVDGFLIVVIEAAFAMLVADVATQFVPRTADNIWTIRILFFLAFFFCGICITMYACYCVSYLKEIGYVASPHVIKFVGGLNLIGSVIWLVFIGSDRIIYFSPYGELMHGDLHWLSQIWGTASIVFISIYMGTRRQILGKRNTFILVSFGFLPLIVLPLELIWDATPVYVVISIALLLIYSTIHVEQGVENVQQGKLIAEQSREIIENRTRIMVSQMQPHFMYNVLNSIYYLCEKDTELAQEAVNTFADYLRINMDALGKSELVPFNTELRHVEKYLALEKMRFDDELNLIYDIQEVDFKLPVLTLQPLVENAVKHGICKKNGGGTVKLETHKEGEYYCVRIIDDGVGYDVNAPIKDDGRSHVGRASVTKRIEMMTSGKIVFDSKIGEGSTVTIYIHE